MSEKIDGAVF